jgi:hypothetical protein
MMGTWINVEEIGTFTLNIDFGLSGGDLAHLTALGQARQLKDISRSTYCKALHEYGVVADDFDQETNDEELQSEMEQQQEQQIDLAKQMAKINPPKTPTAPAPAQNAGQQEEQKAEKNEDRSENQS